MKSKTTIIAVAIVFILAAGNVFSQGKKIQTSNQSHYLQTNKFPSDNFMQNIPTSKINKQYFDNALPVKAEFDTICSENFDTGAPGWTFQDLWSQSFWHTSPTGAYSGYSYWCGVEELGGYDDLWEQTLTSPQLDLSGTTSPVLSFIHHFNVEPFLGNYYDFDAFDALTIRISTDGENYNIINPEAGLEYNAEKVFGFYTRFGSGMAGWSGNSDGWVSASFDLDAYIGQSLWIQFLFGSDYGYSTQDDSALFGWRVDDIMIKDGVNTIFMDDAGDTGDAQFVAGGPGGPNPWHLSTEASVSLPNSVGCFDINSGNYFAGMNTALTSPAISLNDLSPNSTELVANFQIKGLLDHTIDDYEFFDIILADARIFDSGSWSYWNWRGSTPFISDTFCGYNESHHYGLDLTNFLGADSIQFRIILHTLPDGHVISPCDVFIDDFTLVGRTGYNGQQFGTFFDQVNIAPWMERQAIVDSFMATIPTCPLVEDNSIVTYLFQGDVNSVNVPGDVNGWYTAADPMIWIPGTDLWFYQTSYEADARLEYKFFVDGVTWINDPLNPNQANYEYENSQIAMPDYIPPSEIENNDGIPHGNSFDTIISSTILGNTRTIKVYTPPSYANSLEDKFPVVLIHDGLIFYNYGQINNVLDNLIAENRIQPTIAVFVPPVNRDNEYAFYQTSQFETFIIEELMPVIDSKYRTKQDPLSRAMLGVSYGGLISTQICYNRPESFGLCAAMSPAYWPKNFEVYKNLITGPKENIKFYIDWGTYEYDIMLYSTLLKENLVSLDYDLVWNEWHEAHNYGNWRAHLDNSFEYFFPAISGVEDDKERDPFSLNAYPNPFNTSTKISYQLSESAFINLSIYDLSGKEVRKLVNEKQVPGHHEFMWSGENMAGARVKDGVYIFRIKAGKYEVSRKLSILR